MIASLFVNLALCAPIAIEEHYPVAQIEERYVKRHEYWPIRVKFDLHMLEGYNDAEMCHEFGPLKSGIFCTETDIMSPPKIQALKRFLADTEALLGRLFMTASRKAAIQTMNLSTHFGRFRNPRRNFSDVDLVITMYVRGTIDEGDRDLVEYATGGLDNETNYRPIYGIIAMKPLLYSHVTMPLRNEMLVKLLRLMGMDPSLWPYWVKEGSNRRYLKEKPYSRILFPENLSKERVIIHTKSCHQFMIDNFNLTEIGGVKSGLLMKKDLMTLSDRVYFGELISGTQLNVISNATLAFMQGTGWYRSRWENADGNSWFDPRIWGVNPEFPLGRPQNSMPVLHWCQDLEDYACSHDYLSIAKCLPYERALCRWEDDRKYCISGTKWYYNSDRRTYLGKNEDLDYQIAKIPDHMCNLDDGRQAPGAGTWGRNSMCFMSNIGKRVSFVVTLPACYRATCDGDNLTIWIGDEGRLCRYKGEELHFPGWKGYVRCGIPEHVCAVQRHYMENMPLIDRHYSQSTIRGEEEPDDYLAYVKNIEAKPFNTLVTLPSLRIADLTFH